MMRSSRNWQALIVILLTLMITLNVRVLILNSDEEEQSDTDTLQALKARELCDKPVIVNIDNVADVNALNASFAKQKWISLEPEHAKVLGFHRPKKGFLTVGVPSIKRINGMTYLVECLASLVEKTSTDEKMEVVVVVFLGDFDSKYNNDVVKVVTEKFMDYINMGFIQLVQASKTYYPSLTNLKRNFNDKADRVSWRAKQVADFSFMFMYSQNISSYYVQIEDDVICASNFVTGIREYIKSMDRVQWSLLEFSELGFIGKLFKSSDLMKVARYMLMFYQEQPIDWLITYFRLSMAQRKIYLRKPTLFQHIGLKSSFDTSKDNKLRDKFFDSGEKPWKSDDPPGVVVSNMKPFEQWLPGLAYGSGSGFFWATDVKAGDWLTIALSTPTRLKRIVVETGHPKTRKDILLNGTMEWSPTVIKLDEEHKRVTCASLQRLGTFQKGRFDTGALDAKSPIAGALVGCLKISIGPGQKNWVVFNQVAIFVDK